MKNKSAVMILVLVVALFAQGCSYVMVGADKTSVNTKPNETENMESSDGSIQDAAIKGYEIRSVVIVDDKSQSKVVYPQIAGLQGELIMDYINQSLKKTVDVFVENEAFEALNMDYKVTLKQENRLSVLIIGSGKINGDQTFEIFKPVNIDIPTSNEITFENFIKNDPISRNAIQTILDEKAKALGLENGAQFEGISLYFKGDEVIFCYMPLDDQAKDFIQLNVKLEDIESIIHAEFGTRPAS